MARFLVEVQERGAEKEERRDDEAREERRDVLRLLARTAQEEEENAYWESPLRSHVFDVPKRTNVAVDGVPPGRAMPIPYTAACGTCHIVNELPFK